MRVLGLGLALFFLLAGCSEPPPAPDIQVAPGERLVEGVVVDAAIRPVAGARVTVVGAGEGQTTESDGEFAFALAFGAAVFEATHPRFAPVRQTLDVAAGDEAKVVLQFSFTAGEAPYKTVVKYDGFVVCSLGISLIFSEECGEGVGTPVGRFGKQGNNAIRYDFVAEDPSLKTIVLDLVWTPTSEAGCEMLYLFNTAWTCEPACGGNAVGAGSVQGPSPLLLRVDEADLSPHLQDPATVFTTYALARNDISQVNILLNQPFQLFVSTFYREPAPEEYSLLTEPVP